MQALVQGCPRLLAIGGNRPSFDELHRHEGTPVVGQAPVVQSRDPGMLQSSQDLPLGEKTLRLGAGLPLQQLDGDPLLEAALGTRRFVNLSHAATANPATDTPRAHMGSGGNARIVGSHRRTRRC